MIKDYEGTLYGSYRGRTFSDIYPSAREFVDDYETVGIPPTLTAQDALSPLTIYYLLYANYGNSVVASSDENRFKYKLFSIIWQYGPVLNKRRDIQQKLIALSEKDIMQGNVQIYNNAQNPATEPSTDDDEYLAYINQQNVAKNKKGKLEAYALLDSLLKKDVTQEFLNKFKPLFLNIVQPELPLWYESEDENG